MPGAPRTRSRPSRSRIRETCIAHSERVTRVTPRNMCDLSLMSNAPHLHHTPTGAVTRRGHCVRPPA